MKTTVREWRRLLGNYDDCYTLPPERTQPQKLCTANFSSGTLKTLINRLLRLKNKNFWRDPCEKKPFFSRLKSDSQKYILKWSYWPEILAPGLKSIFVTTLFSNFFHFTQPLPSWLPPLKWGKGGIFALLAQNDQKLTSEGLKWPQKMRVEHKICSTMCGTPVRPILDHKNPTGLARWGQGRKKSAREMASVWLWSPPEAPKCAKDTWNGP